MENCQNWYYLCLCLLAVLLIMLAMFFNYNLKLKDKTISLEKEIREVERVNGKEKRDIQELQEKFLLLERKLKKHERKS